METLNKPALGQHFLSVQHLTASQIHNLLDLAEQFLNAQDELIFSPALLKHKTIVNCFLENSTRTRCSFELAAHRLGAYVLNFDASVSSTNKGETLFDTIDYLRAMQADLFVIRHSQEGIPAKIAAHLNNSASVINAGDGCHEHPTQAMLDMFSIRRYKSDFKKLSVAIVGDVAHSRVAQSDVYALLALGVPDIRLVGPAQLLPNKSYGSQVSLHQDLSTGLADVDVVIALRIQKERMQEAALPNPNDYFHLYGITQDKIRYAKKDAIVMHPGPMNRGVEIASDVADGNQSVVFQQAKYGVAVRMAVMVALLADV